jgi:hypothetical protein
MTWNGWIVIIQISPERTPPFPHKKERKRNFRSEAIHDGSYKG